MGIYIETMTMPKSCCECMLCSGFWGAFDCLAINEMLDNKDFDVYKERSKDCPLKEVSNDFGRYINYDLLIETINKKYNKKIKNLPEDSVEKIIAELTKQILLDEINDLKNNGLVIKKQKDK
jgi:hypothetical protein